MPIILDILWIERLIEDCYPGIRVRINVFNSYPLDSVVKISTDEEKEEYHEESLFYDTDDGEDADVVIGDGPIFDEEYEDDVEYIDFINIDKFFYFFIPLIFILKELQVDQELVLFYASKNKFLS